MGSTNRRRDIRIPMQLSLNEYVADKPFRCMSLNLSPSGIYVNHLKLPDKCFSPIVGLEFELPGTADTVWARGQVRYDAAGSHFQGNGIEFTGITQFHQRLIKDYVTEQRIRQLRKLLSMVRRNRLH